VLLDLVLMNGFENTLKRLDGEFAIVFISMNVKTNHVEIQYARDHLGMRPLYETPYHGIILSSELFDYVDVDLPKHPTRQVAPRTVCTFTSQELMPFTYSSYYSFYANNTLVPTKLKLFKSFCHAVQKRMHSDRPIGYLLSGGLDSSSVVAVANLHSRFPLNTFSVSFDDDATDLKYIKMVQGHLNTIHNHFKFTMDEAFNAIPLVIRALGSYDVTTVRASTPLFLLCREISQMGIRVLMCGDIADELMCGYKYFNHAPTTDSMIDETYKLLEEIHYYDVLRSERCKARFNMEGRYPFGDKEFISYILSHPIEERAPLRNMTKLLFREMLLQFAPTLLPKEVVIREKEALSDGVSSESNSWHLWLKNKIKSDTNFTDEKAYYIHLWEQQFNRKDTPNQQHISNWMPTFRPDVADPSAREL
jgi:asparagine synthase (glutamine-hydrolysing)